MALTSNKSVLKWVDEMVALTKPDKVVWIDGSEEQLEALRAEACSTGEMIKLNEEKLPGCYLHRSAVNDVARVEGRTFICTRKEEDAGPTNNWMDPKEAYEKLGDKAPKIFHVNWFRTDDEGNFLWPGFGDNMRVLLWILARCEGKVSARETEIGYLPYVKDIDIEGLENDGKEFTHMMLDELLSVDKALWREDAENIEGFYTSIGERLPAKLWEELETLKKNLE